MGSLYWTRQVTESLSGSGIQKLFTLRDNQNPAAKGIEAAVTG